VPEKKLDLRRLKSIKKAALDAAKVRVGSNNNDALRIKLIVTMKV